MQITSVRDVQAPAWVQGERPRPAVPVLVGAAGGIITLFGVFALFGSLDEDSVRVGGIALSLIALIVGVALLVVEREHGPLRAAGVALAAGAAAPLAFLVVNDPLQVDGKSDFLVAGLLATLFWALLFALGPGRGHGLFLGLALAGLWMTALVQTVPDAPFSPFGGFSPMGRSEAEVTLPADDFDDPFGDEFDEPQFDPDEFERRLREQMEEDRRRREEELRDRPVPSFPDQEIPVPQIPGDGESLGGAELIQFSESGSEPPIAPAVVSFLFGLLYLAGALFLDGMGLRRVDSAAIAVAIVALAFGAAFVGPRHGATAAGIATTTVAVLLLAVGTMGERRFTAWTGAAALAFGVAAMVGDAFDDPGAGAAVAMLVVGGLLVAAARFAADAMQPPSAPPLPPLSPTGGPGDQPPPPPRRIVI